MFSRITNILFGHSTSDDNPQEQNSSRPAEVGMTDSAIDDADWLFVNRYDVELSEEGGGMENLEAQSERTEQLLLNLSFTSTPSKSDSSSASSEETSDFERFRGPLLSMQEVDPQSDTTLSDISSQPEHVTHPSLEECWIVTPPPCFTASESNTDLIQMHPFENLLIEHPSMSVYWPRDQLDFYSEDSLAVEAGEAFETQTLEDYNDPEACGIIDHQLESGGNDVVLYHPRTMLVPRNRPLRAAPDGMSNGRLRGNETDGGIQVVVCKSWSVEEEKGQKQFSKDRNTRKFLYQQNLVREYSSRGKIRPRKDRMGFPSGRSNNRKC